MTTRTTLRRTAAALLLATAVLTGEAAGARAAPVTEFRQGLQAGAMPDGLTTGPDGNLWFVDAASGHGAIGRVTPGGQITEFSAGLRAGSEPHAIEVGGNGNLFFTDDGTTQAIGEITPGGAITETAAGTGGLNPGAVPTELTDGPDGTLWFLDAGPTKAIGEISRTGAIAEHTVSNDPNDILNAIAQGPDGNMYFTIQGHPGIGKLTVATGAVSKVATGMLPNDLTAGPDGNVWFDDDNASTVSRLAVASSSVSDFSPQPGAQPDAMTAGPDGNVWFVDQLNTSDRVGRVTPAGAVTEFKITATPWGITPGIDQNLWFLLGGTVQDVARITPQGAITLVHDGIPASADFTESDIVSGPDGDLWAIDKGTPRAIVRADVQLPPTATTGAASAVTGSSATIAGTANPRGDATTIAVDYGTSTGLGTKAAAGALPEADASSPVSGTLAGLPSATRIFYRIEATNAYGTVAGATESFMTSGRPSSPSRDRSSTTTRRFGDQRITIVTSSPRSCSTRAARLRVAVKSSRIKRSKAKRLHFRTGTLRLDRGRRHVVHKRVRGRRRRFVRYAPNATFHRLPATRTLRVDVARSHRHLVAVKLTYSHTVRRHGHRRRVSSTITVKLHPRVC